MKRTRKWEYVKQEATRLADLGLGAQEIADRVEVNCSTVTRWFQAGKLTKRARVSTGSVVVQASVKNPAAWAEAVRCEYSLSETDDQLLKLAELALEAAHNPLASIPTALAAMRTFQGLARQLALVAKVVEAPADKQSPEAPSPTARVRRPVGADPRMALMSGSSVN